MLQAEGIHKHYATRSGELVVLRDVSLALTAGQSAAILGPSGSGKSTLLNIIGTLEPPTAGHVRLDDCDPFALPERALARFRNQQIGFIFQDHHLLPQCSVLENVLIPTLAGHRAAGDRPAVDRPADAHQHARQLLERVGLSDRLDHRPAELSGGERQRVAVARALINRPKLLLADEPTGNLDRVTADRVADLLAELPREHQVILILVTHSEALAARFELKFDLLDGALAPRKLA
jgi:lipoprotein-releasing system ATP-binding protein